MKGCGRGEGQRIAIEASGAGRGWDTHAGMAQCHRRRFRAPARCRSETPTGRTGQRSKPSRLSFRGFGKGRKRCRFRAPARCRSETGAPSRPGYRSAASAKAGSGAGFALPRDAGRRPALQAVPAIVPRFRQRQEVAQVSRSRAMPVGDRRSKPSPRFFAADDASSRCASPSGAGQFFRWGPEDRRSQPGRAILPAEVRVGRRSHSAALSRLSFRGFGKGRKRRRFRAPARCRSETGAPSRPRASSRLTMRHLAARRAAVPASSSGGGLKIGVPSPAAHASYHRGQVTTMLRQLGAEPPPSQDLITFYRERG